MFKNKKTTYVGLAAIFTSVAGILNLLAGDSASMGDIMGVVTTGLVGILGLFAKDGGA